MRSFPHCLLYFRTDGVDIGLGHLLCKPLRFTDQHDVEMILLSIYLQAPAFIAIAAITPRLKSNKKRCSIPESSTHKSPRHHVKTKSRTTSNMRAGLEKQYEIKRRLHQVVNSDGSFTEWRSLWTDLWRKSVPPTRISSPYCHGMQSEYFPGRYRNAT